MPRLVWAHGLEGSPQGTKVQALRAAGYDVAAADYNGLTLLERVALLERETEGGDVLLAGSSYGGLTAAVVAARHPGRFAGLLLCAPALALKEPPVDDVEAHRAPPGLPTVVIHGTQDTICPLDASRGYAERSGEHVELWVVDDGHRLDGSLDRLVEAVRRLLG